VCVCVGGGVERYATFALEKERCCERSMPHIHPDI